MTRLARPSELADRLDRVNQILDESGWCTGRMTDEHGRHCVAGAVEVAAISQDIRFDVANVLIAQVRHDYDVFDHVIWNDQQTDKRKVQRMVNRAAKNLRSGKMKRTIHPDFGYTGWELVD